MTGRCHRRARKAQLVAVLAVLASGTLSATAAALPEGPGWEVTARNFPANIAPGHIGGIRVELFNVGAGDSSGPVTITDSLPPGVTAIEAGDGGSRIHHEPETFTVEHERWICTGNGPGEAPGVAEATVVTCTNGPGEPSLLGGAGMGTQTNTLAIKVKVASGAREDANDPEDNHVTVVGGGAPNPASTADPIPISSTPAKFGFTDFDVWFSNADGTLDTQAGSHPYAATFSFGFTTDLEPGGEANTGGSNARNIDVELPPGFVGDPTAVPRCSRVDFIAYRCPADSEIGIIDVETYFDLGFRVFNLVPPPGVPAEFGFHYNSLATYIDSKVRSGSDYGITSGVPNAPQREVHHSTLILWGEPEAPSHDRWRNFNFSGEPCSEQEIATAGNACSRTEVQASTPFLTLPTACEAPQPFTIRANTWEHPEQPPAEKTFLWHDSSDNPTGLTGCESLGFSPKISVAPDTSATDTPAGLTVEVKPSVGGLTEPDGLSTSDLENTTVTLPEGVVINPGQAAGLQACQPSQDGLERLPGGEEDEGAPSCPNASKVGVDEIETPLLPKPLKGSVYVLQSNPPDLKLLIAASGEGVNLKLIGDVHLDEATGRLTATFEKTPELPFTDFKLSFSGGAQAALDTPTQCGAYTTSADFTPWSSPFVADAFPSSVFTLTGGPEGGVCPSSPLPFAPSLTAGSTTDQAGGSTGFTMLLSRGDGQQRIERLQFKIPPGLSGVISSVPVCGEVDANAGTCPASSHVGHTVVTTGPGPYPLVIPQPGDPEAAIFLTGPYKGAPFGLSIVTPVIAGPFNLGTIVTRAAIEVDPRTAQITVTTDPLPQVVDGVPTDIRSVDAVIDRPGFMINPTNCEPASFSGTAWGTPPPGAGGAGASAAISSHFQVGSCRSLTFKPVLSVSTVGKASKKLGASLKFKIAYPSGAMGTESWFDEARFDIPKQLPARLSTIQQACDAKTFETNRAACPKHSVIGSALVHTPILPTPLEGPVYFVSYGGAKFPDAVLVLQGDDVNIELHGNTFINGASGVTSATFKALPDVPFQSIEVSLPAGEYSEFGANLPAKDHLDFCGQKLTMPTLFKAQNGLEIKQNTPVNITNCSKAALTRAQSLAASLKACRKDKNKGKRAGCEAQARKKYGPQKKKR